MEITAVNHPLAQPRLTILRGTRTDSAGSRATPAGLGAMLIYEASRELLVDNFDVQTPIATAPGYRLQNPPIIVPVIHARFGTIDPSLSMIPDAQVGFIGLVRSEKAHKPMPYLEALPEGSSGRTVPLADPVPAIGGSLLHALKLLVDRGADNITAVCVISAQQGVDALRESGPPVRLVTTVVNPDLDEGAYIMPGLGDAGDRLYGPYNIDL